MSQEFDAIYERGVFRPLTPLDLPEQTKVHLHMQETEQGAPAGPDEASDLVGLLADEPELVDQIMEDVYRTRAIQPLRTPSNGSSNS